MVTDGLGVGGRHRVACEFAFLKDIYYLCHESYAGGNMSCEKCFAVNYFRG